MGDKREIPRRIKVSLLRRQEQEGVFNMHRVLRKEPTVGHRRREHLYFGFNHIRYYRRCYISGCCYAEVSYFLTVYILVNSVCMGVIRLFR